ncbi:outer membrane protein assembly factor BamB family protein [Halococcoides cellulosivorans]|uniref:Pyrrolo-quinoline quinone repeat domain-containing protein n=1 Tax=Halococcoides cellulosivorans TaxID=1679096 RepID=A0A2R4WXS6_9EURY|nr:PQQ-binding-like beta-propeller repeat protein [Halococcoides cellulosivorans]AWB26338.1 hypothetical protein HARCEL1_00675 [Halococcoides cellulosivorans]
MVLSRRDYLATLAAGAVGAVGGCSRSETGETVTPVDVNITTEPPTETTRSTTRETTPELTGGQSWPAPRFGPGNTAANPGALGPYGDFETECTFTATDWPTPVEDTVVGISTVAVDDGTGYVARVGPHLGHETVAFDIDDGTVLWRSQMDLDPDERILAHPSAFSTTVHLTTTDDRIYSTIPGDFLEGPAIVAFDRSGARLWTHDQRWSTALQRYRDGIVVGQSDGALTAIARDGTVRWRTQGVDAIDRGIAPHGPPAVTDNHVVTTAGDSIVAVDHDGDRQWVRQFDLQDGSGPQTFHRNVVAGSGLYALPATLGSLMCLDPATGETRWVATPKQGSIDEVAVGGDERVTAAGRVGFDQLPAVGDGQIYVTGREEGSGRAEYPRFYALDAESGDLEWFCDLLSVPTTRPVLADGRIYVGLERGEFVAVGIANRSITAVHAGRTRLFGDWMAVVGRRLIVASDETVRIGGPP